MTTKPCTKGPRHKWQWAKNIRVGKFQVTKGGTFGQISLKGLYRCACGAEKHGNANFNDTADLRGTGGQQ